jgi:hypothetical protein
VSIVVPLVGILERHSPLATARPVAHAGRRFRRRRCTPRGFMTKLERLDEVLRRDPQRAKVMILRHPMEAWRSCPGLPSPASGRPTSVAASNKPLEFSFEIAT